MRSCKCKLVGVLVCAVKRIPEATGWCGTSRSLLGMLRGGRRRNRSSVKRKILPREAASDELSPERLGYRAPVTAILLQLASGSWLPCVLTASESCVEAC